MIKTVKVKSNGKVNIGLNIVGRVNEYHSLDTVIAEINFYDIITLRNRNDKKINLTVRGHGHDSISVVDNNVASISSPINFIK